MRVTNRMMGEDFLINLRRNLKNMQHVQYQLATGKEVSRPSDDPYRVTRALSLETSVMKNEQYLRNIEDSIGWVDTNDSALGALGDSLNRVRELMIRAANTGMSETDHKAIFAEMKQIGEGIGDIGNVNYDGRYIFGGQSTTEPPFPKDWIDAVTMDLPLVNLDGVYNGDDRPISREMLPGVNVRINVHGQDILGGGEDQNNLAQTMKTILEILSNPGDNDVMVLGGDLLGEIDGHIENVLDLRTQNGAVSNRLDTLKERNATENLGMKELLAKVEDIDFAEKIMQFAMMENVYRASLSAGSKILQPTLLDYL